MVFRASAVKWVLTYLWSTEQKDLETPGGDSVDM